MFDLSFVKLFCPKKFDQFVFMPSVGSSGGIITIWDSSVFCGTTIFTESFAVGVKFNSLQTADVWNLVNVYGPCDGPDRNTFTSWLFDLDIPLTEDWLLLGDFNFMRSPDNRNKPGGNANDMPIFNDFINYQSLVELPIKGRRYTWSNMQTDPLLEQLDWYFTSANWTAKYPNTVINPLPKPVFDHSPCVVSIESTVPKSKIFRFENFWISHPGFFETVQASWSKYCYAQNSATLLCKKLKNLRYALNGWSKGISRLNVCIDNSNWTLLELDGIEDRRTLTTPEKNFRAILKNHLLILLKYKQEYWKKRYTVRWFQCGGDNTKFFHSAATERYQRNSIASLKLQDGSTVTDHAGKERELFETYKSRLGQSNQSDMKFNLSNIIKRAEGLDELTVPFTPEEIDQVVKEMPSDRAPRPDGFNGCFLKSCWHIIKADFYKLCMDFYEGNLNLQSINSGFITLIPKTPSPESANDYRPITLLNCCLKLITKLLANRLQKIIFRLIHRNQYGFLRGRSIQDCLAWAFEYIHQCQASGKACCILKLDFAKAFDMIEHEPMIEIMKKWGLMIGGLDGFVVSFPLDHRQYCLMGLWEDNSSASVVSGRATPCRP